MKSSSRVTSRREGFNILGELDGIRAGLCSLARRYGSRDGGSAILLRLAGA